MRILVVGQRGDGPVLQRIVSPKEFFEEWGPYAPFLWGEARSGPVTVGDCRVWVKVVP